MKINEVTAYELIQKKDLTDIHSQGYLLRHKKSGARVMLIENEDENKVFNIAFRTPPSDSTGVAHILEHSVLCGSEKFPLKDPFVELVKGSLNTFLNAMTYPDKTTYPVASCNEQDFQNLMHVYLDAVFFPNIYQKEEIFRQEGWSYQMESTDAPISYNGVVYNEMKGVFSSSDDVLEREVMNSLFPDTTYGCESGGDPACIPDLTYEGFLNFHRAYYHPSNSYIYLYGNMDMVQKLEFLDKEYLSRFEENPKVREASRIQEQKPFEKKKESVLFYPISEGESEKDNTYLSYNVVAGNALDYKLCTAFEILDYALLSAPGAPLKKALLDAKIGKDIYGAYDDGIYQPYFTIVAKGANEEDRGRFIAVIEEALRKIVEEGIDPKAVEAGINYMEFRYREADFASYPKGLMFGLDILSSWIYDEENPFAMVERLEVFRELKENLSEGYFESVVEKYLLNNAHGSILTLKPQKGLAQIREKEVETKLAQWKESLSEEDRQAIVDRTRKLREYQEAEENPENLNCIPMLKRSDIERKAGGFCNEEIYFGENLFLYHDVCTNGIGYVSLLFDLSRIPQRLVPYLGLLKSVLAYVDTQNYTYGELFNEINANTGGIICGIEAYENSQTPGEFTAMFGIRGKALYSKIPFLFQMVHEIVFTSNMDQEKRLYEIIAQTKSRAQTSLTGNGHSTAVLRASSYESSMAKFQDEIGGVEYFWSLEELEAEFENKKDEIIQNLKELTRMIFRPENFRVSYTGEKESKDTVLKLAEELRNNLHTEETEKGNLVKDLQVKNEGLKTSGQVQYVAQVGNFRKAGYSYTGALDILKIILGYDYLWMNLRVKGGAYGCMNGFKRTGDSFFVSYRDPNLKQTLETFEKIPEYIRNFQADEREMTKYIIGTISGKDTPKTPKMKGDLSTVAYFSGTTEETLQRERDEILNATPEDIRNLAGLVESVLSQHHICVVGSESAIEQEKELFKEVKNLMH